MPIMSHDEFTRLFQYMQAEFKRMDERFHAIDLRFDKMEVTMDSFLKQSEVHEQEFLVLTHQVDRHDTWIHQLATTTGDDLAA